MVGKHRIGLVYILALVSFFGGGLYYSFHPDRLPFTLVDHRLRPVSDAFIPARPFVDNLDVNITTSVPRAAIVGLSLGARLCSVVHDIGCTGHSSPQQ